jgi:hypothetical protein
MMVPSGIADQTRRVPGFASTSARMSAGTVVWPFAVIDDSGMASIHAFTILVMRLGRALTNTQANFGNQRIGLAET